MEIITAFLAKYAIEMAVGTIGSFILGWILKKIPTGKWSKQLGKVGEKNGQVVTAFCQKKIPFWNKIIEPIFVDLINVILAWFAGFIVGLKSDDTESEKPKAEPKG